MLLFGTRPYLQTPLTFDRTAVRAQLREALTSMAGPLTGLGDAIGLAVKRLREQASEHRVLILVTDGRNTAGTLHPLDAAEIAAHEGTRIYTVAVGTELTLAEQRAAGSNAQGRSLDEPTLRDIARITGGEYFRGDALDTLDAISAEIDRLEPVARPGEVVRPVREHYPLPLALSGLFALSVLLFEPVRGALSRVGRRVRAKVASWIPSNF